MSAPAIAPDTVVTLSYVLFDQLQACVHRDRASNSASMVATFYTVTGNLPSE